MPYFCIFSLQEIEMAASPSIISTGDSGYPDSNWSGGGPTPKASSSESSVTSSKNGNNR